jgi:UDP-N-acetylmuramoylalanine--D-glutamate ligase
MKKPFAQYRSFFVLGMARSGIAVSGLLAKHGHAITVFDDDASTLSKFVATDVAREHGGRIAVAAVEDVDAVLAASDCMVVSPGVPLENRVVRAALSRGIPVIGEIEVAAHFTRAPFELFG